MYLVKMHANHASIFIRCAKILVRCQFSGFCERVVNATQRDKWEFASASEPIFEPRKGRKIIARGGTATCLGGAAQQRRREPWNPGERKKKKIEPGATERQRRSVGRQIRARTVAKRSSEPWWARIFCVSGILKQCGISRHALCHPCQGSHLFLLPIPGVLAPDGASPRATIWRPCRGSEFRSPSVRKLIAKL